MSSISFGIVVNLLNFVIASSHCVDTKRGLFCIIIANIFAVIILLLYVVFLLSNTPILNNASYDIIQLLPVFLYVLICASPLIYYMIILCLTCINCKVRASFIPILSSCLYFVTFICIIVVFAILSNMPPILYASDSAELDHPKIWKDTINYSHILDVNLTFISLYVAITTLVFFFLVFLNYAMYVNVIKLTEYLTVNNKVQAFKLARRSDYSSMVIGFF